MAKLEELMREAGPREAIPPGDLDSIRDSAREEWRDLVARQESRPAPGFGRYLALAAGLLIAAGVGWWLWPGAAPEPPAIVAKVELTRGLVEARFPDAAGRAGRGTVTRLAAGGELVAGTEIETGVSAAESPSRIALTLGEGVSVRADEGTVIELLSDRRIRLERGAVYADTGSHAALRKPIAEPIEIVTAHGNITDIGTRFEVRVGDSEETSLRIRVRDGAVALHRDGEAIEVSAAEQIALLADGTVTRTTVAPAEEGWAWAREAAPAIGIEGRSLREYLDWVSRETGLEIRFASAGLAAAAAEIRLFGSIEGLTPEESLEIVLPGSALTWTVEGENLLISDLTPPQNS